MNRRNLLLGTAGLAVGITGCSNSSNGSSQASANKVTLDDCPALKAYIDSLCDIPGGTFKMGSSDGEPDEAPVHEVPISAFRMGKTPITVAMWEEYVKASGKAMPPKPDPKVDTTHKHNNLWMEHDHPMTNLIWDDCRGYANWASNLTDLVLYLPSEAQWEYACRGGREGLKYPWGNRFDVSNLWCSLSEDGDRGTSGSVNRRVYIWRDHPWHLIDMIGNCWEWCQDWFDPSWYRIPQSKERNVINLDSSPLIETRDVGEMQVARCVRGGSWYYSAPTTFCCSTRACSDQVSARRAFSNTGFRLAAGPM